MNDKNIVKIPKELFKDDAAALLFAMILEKAVADNDIVPVTYGGKVIACLVPVEE